MTNRERLEKGMENILQKCSNAKGYTLTDILSIAEDTFVDAGYRNLEENINILIVRLDSIGDMICTIPFLRNVRTCFPGSHITIVCTSKGASVIKDCPYCDEVRILDMPVNTNTVASYVKFAISFCRKHLWKRQYSIAFVPRRHTNILAQYIIAFFSGAIVRVGYSWNNLPVTKPSFTDDVNFLINKQVSVSYNVNHIVETSLRVLSTLLPYEDDYLETFSTQEDIFFAAKIMKELPAGKKKVIICHGASAKFQKWPAHKYLTVLKELAKQGYMLISLSDKEEYDKAHFLEENLPYGSFLNLCGATTVSQAQTIVRYADYYLGNDTSILHMAAAAKKPVLGIYRSPSKHDRLYDCLDPAIVFKPWQTKHVIVQPEHPLECCANKRLLYGFCWNVNKVCCIDQVTTEEVLAGFEKLTDMRELVIVPTPKGGGLY